MSGDLVLHFALGVLVGFVFGIGPRRRRRRRAWPRPIDWQTIYEATAAYRTRERAEQVDVKLPDVETGL